MKMKRLNVYLSLIAFLQILVFAIGADLISEYRKPIRSREWLILDWVIELIVILAASAIYVVVFRNTEKRKK